MTRICLCDVPLQIIDSRGKEFLAIPTQVLKEQGYSIPKEGIAIVDDRLGKESGKESGKEVGKEIEYIAMPIEEIGKYGKDNFPNPDIDIVEEEVNGIVGYYVAVMWEQSPSKIDGMDGIKKYDVRGHIFVAGCEPSDMKIEEGKLQCVDKSIYIVEHHIDEWNSHHIVELKDELRK